MVKTEAAQWVVRLADPGCTAEERARFAAWRSADPRHEAAFERESAAWEAIDRLRALRSAFAAPDPDLLAPRARFAPSRIAAAIGAAAMLVTGVGGSVGFVALASPAYATGIGERRVVRLDDGSSVELNTDSRIVVHRLGRRPSVELVRGEALFTAGKGGPLLIRAGDRRIAAPGGQLLVRLDHDTVDVTVRAGAAEVSRGEAQPMRLAPGSVGVYGESVAQVREVGPEEVERSLAWRQGAIALQGETLSQAVAEINRYNTTRIIVADPAISGLRLAGYFRSDDPRAFVTAVTRAFPVRASTTAGGDYSLSSGG